MTDMAITAIAPWLGSKRSLAPLIVRELGPHHAYFDVPCGSLAVVFEKPPSPQETAVDLHGDLTNLAFVLQNIDQAEALYDRLSRTLFADGVLDRARAYLRDAGDLPLDAPADPERAYWYFIQAWAGRNGVAGALRDAWQLCVRWTPGGGGATTRWRNAVESIPAWHTRLRHVVILRRDLFKVIPKIPDDMPGKVALYCDPPYTLASRSGDNNGGYKHDFTDFGGGLLPDDHTRLRDELRRFDPGSKPRSRVVVSYYDDPRIRDLYEGWTVVECYRHKNLHTQNARRSGVSKAPEILIINGPSYTAADAAEG